MLTYVAIFRGEEADDARMIAVSSDPQIVAEFADRIAADPRYSSADPAIQELHRGRLRALRVIAREAMGDSLR